MMGFSRKFLKLGVSALAISVFVPGVAMAQGAEEAEAPRSDAIIVTAQGREQNLQDVPVAVSVVSGEALTEQALLSLEDVSDRLPNVNIAGGFLNVRGVGSGQNAGFEQSVGTYVDGLYRPRSAALQAALFDIERIEVLKGPQTTFFGANSIAGGINITTRKPGSSLGANVTARYGTYNEYNFEAGVDLPVTPTLAVRLAGRVNGIDGFVDTPAGGEHSDGYQLRGVAVWEPSSNFESEFRIDYGDTSNVGATASELVGCPVPGGLVSGGGCANFLANSGGVVDDVLDFNSDSGPTSGAFEFTEVELTNTIGVFGGDLIVRTGYYDHASLNRFTGIPFPITTASPPLGEGESGFPLNINEDFSQFSQEVRFQGDIGDVAEFTIGGYYAKADLESRTKAGFFFVPFGAIASGIPGSMSLPTDNVTGAINFFAEDKTYSAFVATTLFLSDSLRANVGLRYTQIDKFARRENFYGTTTNNNEPGTFVPYDPVTNAILAGVLASITTDFPSNNQTYDDWMPSASLQYDVSDDIMVYASYANGFKAGGFSGGADLSIYEPEYVDSFEIGMKGDLLDGLLGLNLNVFSSNFTNLQEAASVNVGTDEFPSLANIVRNAGKARTQGVEVDGVLRPTSNLSINFGLAYLDSKYTSFEDGTCTMTQNILNTNPAGCVQDLSGAQRAYAPEWSGNLGVSAIVPVSDYEIVLNPTVYFSDDFFLSANNDELLFQEGFAKIDMRVSFGPNDGTWNLAVIGKNLTDKVTAASAGTVIFSEGSSRYNPNPPRTFSLQFTYEY